MGHVRAAKDRDRMTAQGAEAIALRIRGMSYHAIGEQLGVSHNAAFLLIRRELAKVAAKSLELATVERDTQLARLDEALSSIWPILSSDNEELRLKAIDRLVKLEERRAKLLGLDAPERITAAIASTEMQSAKTPADAARIMREFFGTVGPTVVNATGEEASGGDSQSLALSAPK